MIKHPHHDLIIAWAADTSRVVQWSPNSLYWLDCEAGPPDWNPELFFRFKPEPKPDRVVSIPMKYRRMEFNAELQAENAQLREQIKQEQADYHMKCNELELIHDQLTAAQSELANANTVNKAAALEIVELRGKRVALSDEQITEARKLADNSFNAHWGEGGRPSWDKVFARAIEAAHGIGEAP